MRLTVRELDDYVADLAEPAEMYGIDLALAADESLVIDIEPDGTRRFTLVGFLPDARQPPRATIEVAERWRRDAEDGHERSGYRYQLIDHERSFRRAFHWHDAAALERRFGVVVHEHCESPIGAAPCPHFFGPPVRDGYRAIDLLMSAWVGDPPNCSELPCLEPL